MRSRETQAAISRRLREEIEELKAQGAGDIVVVCGGVIPPKDHAGLKAAGVAAVYGPGTNIPAAAEEVLEIVSKRRAA